MQFHIAPSIFPMGYNLIKHLLDETTRKKIHVLGSKWITASLYICGLDATHTFPACMEAVLVCMADNYTLNTVNLTPFILSTFSFRQLEGRTTEVH